MHCARLRCISACLMPPLIPVLGGRHEALGVTEDTVGETNALSKAFFRSLNSLQEEFWKSGKGISSKL